MRLAIVSALMFALAAVVVLSPGGSTSEAGATCANTYARFQWLGGTWEGSWTNLDFQNTGDVTMDATLNEDCTGQATIDGVSNQPPGQVVDFTYRDDNGGATIEVSDDPKFGDATISVSADGELEFSAVFAPGFGPESVAGLGTILPDEIDLEFTLTLPGDDTTDEVLNMSHDPTYVHGDVNCDLAADSIDGLSILLDIIGADVDQAFGCPAIASIVPPLWGDVGCDGNVDENDTLALLQNVGGLPVQQEPGCALIGDPLAQ